MQPDPHAAQPWPPTGNNAHGITVGAISDGTHNFNTMPIVSPVSPGPTSPGTSTLDAHNFYWPDGQTAPTEPAHFISPTLDTTLRSPVSPATLRSASHSPSRRQSNSASQPPVPTLNSMRSTPMLQQTGGRVRNMANRFDQGQTETETPAAAGARSAYELHRKPVGGKSRTSLPAESLPSHESIAKLPRRKPTQPRSPNRTPVASFGSASSFSSAQTQLSAHSHSKAPLYPNSRPLFGEITADGQWNGNFQLKGYESRSSNRRSSEGAANMSRGRSQSTLDKLPPPPVSPQLNHRRSRSDLHSSEHRIDTHAFQRSSPISALPHNLPHRAGASSSQPRPRRNTDDKENSTPGAFNYHDDGMLSARIIAPLPKLSPPLRSSRPRQPVNAATTSASRAREANRHEGRPSDTRKPSEQWLDRTYDSQQDRSKRNIPELGMVDFAERRARIQKAISQNLEESRSQESLRRATAASRQSSRHREKSRPPDSDAPPLPNAAEQSGGETPTIPGEWPSPLGESGRNTLSLTTTPAVSQAVPGMEPSTPHTVFEDESPILGRTHDTPTQIPAMQNNLGISALPPLLTAATYKPGSTEASTGSTPFTPIGLNDLDGQQMPSLLKNVMQMRRQSPSTDSRSGPEYEDSHSVESSPSDIEHRWGLSPEAGAEDGSIRIMLSNDLGVGMSDHRWPSEHSAVEAMKYYDEPSGDAQLEHDHNSRNGISNDDRDSHFEDSSLVATPRKNTLVHDNGDVQRTTIPEETWSASAKPDGGNHEIANNALNHYRASGNFTPGMLEELQKHTIDLDRASANVGSNAFMVQNLLDSVFRGTSPNQVDKIRRTELLAPEKASYGMPPVTPDTPPGWRPEEGTGTAMVFHSSPRYGPTADADQVVDDDDDDFAEKIRKADEAWERQQRGELDTFGRNDTYDEDASTSTHQPPLPPKDANYIPRASMSMVDLHDSDPAPSLRTHLDGSGGQAGINSTRGDVALQASLSTPTLVGPSTTSTPLQIPPVPPMPPLIAPSPTNLPLGAIDSPFIPTTAFEPSERSPHLTKSAYAASASSRPSVDSQRVPTLVAPSMSVSSLGDSTRQTSVDTADAKSQKLATPSVEQKRLLKRRHIIKELLDTENSYHQDLKIIEDIYRATATPELVSNEDKKILFGNCDEIERFSLHFYDELRRAVTSVYVPPKSARWGNKRGSFSTTQSDGASQTSPAPEAFDNDKDLTTVVGQAFLANLPTMESVYTAYLKNHDAANQRLAALRNTDTVKCWLEECHNNASDITTAWDLDSLLVKPTQRVAKYPMLLQQLLETTPQGHPDREALGSAVKDSIAMLTRINEAKKRADLVDQIVNRKGKDTDVRSGIAKAFGRRTEKLKERVGMAEAFQDPEFDELAHKFGGHFIRLQICMRDVQDYLHRVEKAMDQITHYANALDSFTDITVSSMAEIESKWRKYGLVVREIVSVAFTEHKAAINKRVIAPMITCIRLHDGPQNAISKRKKRIIDYAKCKSLEKRGEKPDRRTIEAAELYEALNDQLKIDLPKLYSLTANLVQACLNCFLDIQLSWYRIWERKLRPILDSADIPTSIQQIEPAFRPDFDLVKNRMLELGICNGTILAEQASSLLSPSATTLVNDSEPSSAKASFSQEDSRRAQSVGSNNSTLPAGHRRRSSGYANYESQTVSNEARLRSTSLLSQRGPPSSHSQIGGIPMSRPWSNGSTLAPGHSTRPEATQHQSFSGYTSPRQSVERSTTSRPTSGATFYTAVPSQSDNTRFSGIFSSAVPPDTTPDSSRPLSPKLTSHIQTAPKNMRVLFVCASLFEFSIDKTRREAGYPYLTYVQGEVFDVVAQKGELWLAKNQDDSTNSLGWIWEQHFVILSQE